jgi:hypothetical protein
MLLTWGTIKSMLRECWPRVTSAMKELANALQTLSMLGACWPILGYAISLLADYSVCFEHAGPYWAMLLACWPTLLPF